MIPGQRYCHPVKEWITRCFRQLLALSMASLFSSLKRSLTRLLILVPVILGLCLSPMSVGATYPSDFSRQDVSLDLHGQDLQNREFVKYDLYGFDLSDADLRGAYFSVSNAQKANLRGANLEDVIAYATRFDNADLTGTILRNADLLKSRFDNAVIEGADFSDANLDLSQQKDLCKRASGKNPKTGVETYDSLECRGLGDSYAPANPSGA